MDYLLSALVGIGVVGIYSYFTRALPRSIQQDVQQDELSKRYETHIVLQQQMLTLNQKILALAEQRISLETETNSLMRELIAELRANRQSPDRPGTSN
jgi:hypothetical protein